VNDDVVWDGKNEYGEAVASGIYIIYYASQYQVRTAKIIGESVSQVT
jgi:hypothetical protein